VVFSELFTAFLNTVQSFIWYGKLSSNLLVIGALDALFVPLIVVPVVIYFTKHTTELKKFNERLQQEIMDHERADLALRESESRLRTVVENTPVVLFALDSTGVFTLSEGRGLSALGLRPGEVVGRSVFEVYSGAPSVLDGVRRALAGETFSTETEAGGRVFEIWYHPVRNERNELTGTIGVATDITERKRAEVSRQESEARYRTLFDGSPDAILLADPETGIILDANPAASRLLARRYEEIIGLHQSKIHPPRKDAYSRETFTQHVEETREQKGSHPIENAVLRPDGSEVLVEVLAQLVTIRGKEILQGVFRDITERKMTEQKLEESIERFRRLSDAGFEGIVISEQGIVVDANARMAEMLGCKFSDLIGSNISAFVAPESLESVEDHIRSGSEDRYELFARRKDGSLFPVEIQGRSLPYEGRMLRITAVRDITERKEAEEALRHEKAFSDAIIDNLPGVFYMCDEEGRLLRWNHNETAMTGYSMEELSKMNLLQLFREDREMVASKMREVFEIGKTSGEVSIVTKSGMPMSFLFTGFRMVAGSKPYMVGVGIDISERKQLEAQLRHAQKMEAIGVLAGGIAHDFNNILSAIIGYAALMKMKMNPDDDLRHHVERIVASAERAAKLTHDLLAFSRKHVVDLNPLNINDIICGLQNLLTRLIGENIEFNVQCSAEDLIAEVDKGQIEQVLMNIATNARDAMPRGGILQMATHAVDIDGSDMIIPHDHKPGRYVLITVSDTGHGMDKKTQEHIFEPFYTTKEVGKGTGLGLAITYGIIKKHNGYIYVQSEPGHGTTFKIYLPLVEAAVKEVRREEFAMPSSGHETILLIEDDSGVRRVTMAMLKEFGYTVIEAVDGEEGVRLFQENQHKIQLILCDLIMPNKNGKEVYEEIKKTRPDIKVVFMSGYTADIIAQHGILEKGVNFISKPVSPSELLEKIRVVLGS
jgi:PAS domain S-box-containing protein